MVFIDYDYVNLTQGVALWPEAIEVHPKQFTAPLLELLVLHGSYM